MSLYVAIAAGFTLSILLPNQNISSLPGYELILYALLAIGLYGSVYGIDIHELRNHRGLIIRAVTIGVILKSILTGSILWLIFQSPYAFLLGIIVAQIDPLSVASLLKGNSGKFSKSGSTILRAWSSFDDPMTVLLAFYIYLPLTIAEGSAFAPEDWLLQLGANILFALIVGLLGKSTASKHGLQLTLLGIVFLFAVYFKLMLGIALVGLFLRPRIKQLSQLVEIAFITAAVVLGSLLEINSINIIYGMTLGALAFMAQGIVTFFIAPGLRQRDKLLLAIAQYNGITSVILALVIAQWIEQAISIVAFAIVTINTLHYAANHIAERVIKQPSGEMKR